MNACFFKSRRRQRETNALIYVCIYRVSILTWTYLIAVFFSTILYISILQASLNSLSLRFHVQAPCAELFWCSVDSAGGVVTESVSRSFLVGVARIPLQWGVYTHCQIGKPQAFPLNAVYIRSSRPQLRAPRFWFLARAYNNTRAGSWFSDCNVNMTHVTMGPTWDPT